MAPLGTKFLAHAKPVTGTRWVPYSEECWYVGPDLDHYRCMKCYFPNTRMTRVVDTLTIFTASIPFPKVTTENFIKQAALDIVYILTNPPLSFPTSLQAGDPLKNALLKIVDALHQTVEFPVLQHPIIHPPYPRMEPKSITSTLSPRVYPPIINPPSSPRVDSKTTTSPPRVYTKTKSWE